MQQILKILFELGPIGIFFFVNSFADVPDGERIFYATGAFMVATTIALAGSWIMFKKIAAMPLVSGVFVLVFGGLTLYLQDDLFIKIKPTLVNLMFAGILFGGLYFNRLLLKLVFAEGIQLTDEGWHKLTIRWSLFFIFLAIVNEFVWRSFSTDFWVAFKVWGILPLTLVFTIAQIGLIQKYGTGEFSKK
ncbi:MAG: septation protein A [Pseudomonadota bacterium]